MSKTIISFISAKGGSGKTVLSSSIATFLSELGHRVLMVDCDASTNGLTLFYLENVISNKKSTKHKDVGIFDHSDSHHRDCVKLSKNLDFIPSTYNMINTEQADIEAFHKALIFASSESSHDFVIIDAQAGIDNFAKIAIAISDKIVIVSEYDPVSVQGIDRLKVIFSEWISKKEVWTLFNKILPEFSTVIGDGLAVAKYLPPVPWDEEVVHAFSRRDLAINMSKPNPFTLGVAQVCEMLVGRKIEKSLFRWRRKSYESVTEPLKSKLAELDLAASIINESIDRKEKFHFLMAMAGFGLMVLIIVLMVLYVVGEPSRNTLQIILAIGAALIGIMLSSLATARTLTLRTRRYIRNRSSDLPLKGNEIISLSRLNAESRKVSTALEAAEAIIGRTEGRGFHERRRVFES